MIKTFVMGATFAFAAAIQPGPLLTYVISQTLAFGWKRSWPAAFAPLLSDIPIAVLALSVLNLAPASVLNLLQCAGGLFLLYLSALAYRAWRRPGESEEKPGRGSIFKAALVNLLNPNPYLGWSLVMGPLLLRSWKSSPLEGLSLLAGFYGTLIGTTLAIVVLFAAAGHLGPRVNRSLVGLSSMALGLFALYELWSGARALLAT